MKRFLVVLPILTLILVAAEQNNHLKRETLLLRRAPDGTVSTLAGSTYGHQDGKGREARFSNVGGITFGPDGSLFLTDGDFLRKVMMDGTVTTIAENLSVRTKEDSSPLFAGDSGTLAGLTVDKQGVVYVADSGNRRLLKIDNEGKVSVALRSQSPYFPTGAFAAPTGDVYILEVGFTLPGRWSGPRIRKLSADGQTVIIATVGVEGGRGIKPAVAQVSGASVEEVIRFFYFNKWSALLIGTGFLGTTLVGLLGIWKRRHRRRHA